MTLFGSRTRRQPPRVSIIIATYNTGEGVDGLFATLDDLAMSPGDYEVIIVDDGSKDDTFERIERAASTRPHIEVTRIANSGWPSRPRNIALGKARGEYVFFMDHDDYLFPHGLSRAVDYAMKHGLDMLATKEVVAGWSTPGWSCFRANLVEENLSSPAPVQCITPHKLYRREFLEIHQLRFPEETRRLEDFHLNGAVVAAGAIVGVFAETPVYRWELHDGNTHKSSYDLDEYWRAFDNSLAAVRELPAGITRDVLLARWFRTLVLDRVGPGLLKRRDHSRDELMGILGPRMRYFPPAVDAYLTPFDRVRAELLRKGAIHGLMEFAHFTSGMKLVCDTTSATWQDGALTVSASGHVRAGDGRYLPMVRDNGATGVLLPTVVSRELGRDSEVIGEGVAGPKVEVVIRHRASNVDWTVPSEGDLTVNEVAGLSVLKVALTGSIDVSRTPFGDPLGSGIFDIFHRIDGFGFVPTSRVRSKGMQDALLTLPDGSDVNVYSTSAGFLAFDRGGAARPSAARFDVRDGWTSSAVH